MYDYYIEREKICSTAMLLSSSVRSLGYSMVCFKFWQKYLFITELVALRVWIGRNAAAGVE